MTTGVLIAGASHAGVQIAVTLRAKGYGDRVVIVDSDANPPYQRPPLSKAFLAGSMSDKTLQLRVHDFYESRGIELILGDRLVDADPDAGRATTSAGRRLDFDQLALTVGARVRRLEIPGTDLRNITYLRTYADAVRLREALPSAARVVVVGGGYIGLEAASFASKQGKPVTVVEAMPRLLQRTASPFVSEYFADLHARHGVDVRLGRGVTAFTGDRGAVSGVQLDDGEILAADLVVVGIGVVPRTELAVRADLDVAGAVIVDDRSRTSHPRVVAAGDCTQFPYHPLNALIRLESVQNAADQAAVAAATILGHDDGPYRPIPRFWSDQFGVKFQSAGLSTGYDDYTVEGGTDHDKFLVRYFRDGSLIAADTVNWPAEHMAARKELARLSVGVSDSSAV